MKTCSKCGVLKEEKDFYQTNFLSGPKTGQHFIRARCKPCVREESKVVVRTCTRCGETKPADQFKPKGINVCLACLMHIPETKACTKCKQVKPSIDFGRRSQGFPVLNSQCKQCYADGAVTKRSLDPAKYRAAYDKWRKAFPEKARAATKKWLSENAEKEAATRRANKVRRYREDLNFKLKHHLGTRIRSSLKRTTTRKCAGTLKLLGCHIEELRSHLEKGFKPGMTWENYGPVWHVDHIKPCAKFNLTDPEQQRICFHWTNLQPLFAADNIRKSDKYGPQV